MDLILDDVVLRFDGVVVEVFVRAFDKPLRVPAAWLGVEVKARKNDELTLRVGTVNAGTSLYGPDASVLGNYLPIDTTLAQEPTLRDFFAQVAAAVGRSISG